MATVLAVAAVVFVAASAQSIAGFGFGMLAIPPLALLTDPRAAVVVAALAGLVQSMIVTAREWDEVRWGSTGWLLAACVVGMPAGLVVLRAAPERALTALIAVCVLAGTWVVWRGVRLAHPGRPAIMLIGLLVGTLTTATGTSGPPLVAAFHAMGYRPRAMRATVAAVFTVCGLASVAGFALAGLVSVQVAGFAAAALPAVLIGWWVGNAVFGRIDATRFRTVVLAALVVSATVTLARVTMG